MNDTELEQIVQRMIDAGEPETSIAAVIKQYDADMASEAAGAPTPEGQVEPLESRYQKELTIVTGKTL